MHNLKQYYYNTFNFVNTQYEFQTLQIPQWQKRKPDKNNSNKTPCHWMTNKVITFHNFIGISLFPFPFCVIYAICQPWTEKQIAQQQAFAQNEQISQIGSFSRWCKRKLEIIKTEMNLNAKWLHAFASLCQRKLPFYGIQVNFCELCIAKEIQSIVALHLWAGLIELVALVSKERVRCVII